MCICGLGQFTKIVYIFFAPEFKLHSVHLYSLEYHMLCFNLQIGTDVPFNLLVMGQV